ncbi:cache domain-containing protein [Oceanimonas sp. NS1]|nr:cache domain-containing protein [Oceanimonas sp. NS1]
MEQAGDFQLAYLGTTEGVMIDAQPRDRSGYDPRTRPWYKQALQANTAMVTPPYEDVAFGVTVVTLAQPVTTSTGQLLGIIGADVAISSLVNDVNAIRLPAQGQAMMLSRDGTLIAYQDASLALQPATRLAEELTAGNLSRWQGSERLNPVSINGTDKLIHVSTIPGSDWQLLFMLDKAALEAPSAPCCGVSSACRPW